LIKELLKTKLHLLAPETQYWSNSSEIKKYLLGRRSVVKSLRPPLSGGKLAGRSGYQSPSGNKKGVLMINFLYTIIYLRKALSLITKIIQTTYNKKKDAAAQVVPSNLINPGIVFISNGLEPKLNSIVKLAANRANCRVIDKGQFITLQDRGQNSILIVFNPNENQIAIKEAQKMKIPVIAFINHNSNIEGVTIPIPANINHSAGCSLMSNLIANAIIDQKNTLR